MLCVWVIWNLNLYFNGSEYMKIGVFGGTFNPVHNGHLSLASQLVEQKALDKVLFVVSARPPHKDEPAVTPQQRFEMVCLALAEFPAFEACDLELKRGGKSYTIDTMAEIRALYPKDSVYFITGADMFIDIPNWRAPELLFQREKFIVADRENAFQNGKYLAEKNCIMEQYHPQVQFIKMETPNVSSSMLRTDLEKYKDFLPAAVYRYIKRNGLYE